MAWISRRPLPPSRGAEQGQAPNAPTVATTRAGLRPGPASLPFACAYPKPSSRASQVPSAIKPPVHFSSRSTAEPKSAERSALHFSHTAPPYIEGGPGERSWTSIWFLRQWSTVRRRNGSSGRPHGRGCFRQYWVTGSCIRYERLRHVNACCLTPGLSKGTAQPGVQSLLARQDLLNVPSAAPQAVQRPRSSSQTSWHERNVGQPFRRTVAERHWNLSSRSATRPRRARARRKSG